MQPRIENKHTMILKQNNQLHTKYCDKVPMEHEISFIQTVWGSMRLSDVYAINQAPDCDY